MKPDKSKVISVLLAVFFSFWTWLYTYRLDSNKFWIGAFAFLFGCFVFIFSPFLFYPITLGIWVWAIVETSSRDEKVLEKYWSLKIKYK